MSDEDETARLVFAKHLALAVGRCRLNQVEWRLVPDATIARILAILDEAEEPTA